MTQTKLNERRVTIYLRGEFFGNIHRIEASAYAVEVGRYAQYPAAVHCAFRPKGCRRVRGTAQGYEPSLLILDGWGHPEPASMMTEPESTSSGTVVQVSRYMSCSPEWQSDFDAMIGAYLVEHPEVTVVADYRGHDTHTVPKSAPGAEVRP